MLGKPLDYKVPGLKIIYPKLMLRQMDHDDWIEEYRMAWKFYLDGCPYGHEYVMPEDNEEEAYARADHYIHRYLYPDAFYWYNKLSKD